MHKRSFFRQFLRVGGWIALLPALLVLVLGILYAVFGSIAGQLERDGVMAEAEVLERWIRMERDSDGDTHRVFGVTYSFTPDDHPRMEVEEKIGRKMYNALEKGQFIPVRYVLSNPEVSEVNIGSSARIQFWIGLALWPSVAALIWCLWYFGRVALRARKLVQDGTRRSAIVSTVEPSGTTVNGERYYILRWADDFGVEGKSFPRSKADLPHRGDQITVIVDQFGKLPPIWEGDA